MNYLQELQESLNDSKEMLELLNNRVAFLRVYSHKSPYQINEDKIELIKTKGQINTLRSIIAEKEKYFEKYAKQFEIEVAEMELNYDNLIKIAKVQKKNDVNFAKLFDNADFSKIESSPDTKLAFYKTLKSWLAKK